MGISTERPLTGNRQAGFFAEFVRGAVRPSLAAALGAIFIAAALVVISCLLVTEQRVGHLNPGYVMVSPTDEYARLTIDTLRVAHLPPEPLSAIIVGDSSLREAITSEEDLRERIKRKSGQDVTIHLLAAGGLTHWETAAIVDRLSKRTHGVIIAEISPYQLVRQVARLNMLPRLGFTSAAYDRELRIARMTPPPDTHTYFLNEAWFFLLRPGAIHNLIHGPLRDAPGAHLKETAQWEDKYWHLRRRQIYGWARYYARSYKRNLGVYQRMAQRIRQTQGLQFALANAVTNPYIASPLHPLPKGFAATQKKYATDVARFAARNNLPYWDIAAEAQLTADDFSDYTHVRHQSARERFTDVLAGRIAQLLPPAIKPEQSL